jgi:hypothetical protein
MLRSKELTVEPYYKDFHDEVIKSQTRLSLCRINTQDETNTCKHHYDNEIKEIDEDGYERPITTGDYQKQKEFVEDQDIPIVERIKDPIYDEIDNSLIQALVHF